MEEGNQQRYLLLAPGEIVLVVFVILIALQINNWRESAIPNDYKPLFEDQVFKNHIQWIKNAAMYNKPGNEELIKEIHAVINLIEQEQNEKNR